MPREREKEGCVCVFCPQRNTRSFCRFGSVTFFVLCNRFLGFQQKHYATAKADFVFGSLSPVVRAFTEDQSRLRKTEKELP